MTRGRPFEVGNKFGRGRPKGSRDKSTLAMLLAKHEEMLAVKCISQAMKDNTPSMRLLLKRVPLPRPTTRKLKLPPITTSEEILKAHDVVWQSVSDRKCTAAEGQNLTAILEGRQRLMTGQDFYQRFQEVEQIVKKAA